MNTFKVIVPFRINNKKEFEKKKATFIEWKDNGLDNNKYLFNHILAQIEKIKKYEYRYQDIISEIYVLATGKGFFAINYEISTEDVNEVVNLCEQCVTRIDSVLQFSNADESKEKQIIDKFKDIVEIDVKKCYWFFTFDKNNIVKEDKLLFKMLHLDEPNIESNGKFSNDDNIYEVNLQFSKGNWCCISTKCMGIFYPKEDCRNDSLSYAFFTIFLLLHHEKTMMIEFKKTIIINDRIGSKEARRLKREILECLSKYSFESVSDNTICQNIYSNYKNILGLSDMENNMQELIFTLNDEIQRKRGKMVTIVTVVISILGLVSVISSVLDIITFFS